MTLMLRLMMITLGLTHIRPITMKNKKRRRVTQNYKEMFKDLKQFGINEGS